MKCSFLAGLKSKPIATESCDKMPNFKAEMNMFMG